MDCFPVYLGETQLEKKPVHICPKPNNVAGSSTRMKLFVSLAYFSLSEVLQVVIPDFLWDSRGH
jgi:hypothetical protein